MGLVEREAAVASFDDALTRARQGTGSLLVQTGPGGSGRTALLTEFAARATAVGALCLHAAGSWTERDLPLGLIDQLWHDLPAQPGTSMGTDSYRALPKERLGAVLHGFTSALLELGRRRPLLVALDNLHDVDVESLRCLLHLARRLRSAPVVVVCCGGEPGEAVDAALYCELLEQATTVPPPLAPLTVRGVAEVFAGATGGPLTAAAASACHAATGGNPLLVRALAADLRGVERVEPDDGGHIRAGAAYERAVLSWVNRFDAVTRRVLFVVAILGDAATPALIARLIDIDPAVATRAVTRLETVGLLKNGVLRHPQASTAVLGGAPYPDATSLQLRSAVLLHEDGAAPVTIARLLITARHRVDAWAVPVLKVAAEQLLGSGDGELAVKVLRLAQRSTEDGAGRISIKAIVRFGVLGPTVVRIAGGPPRQFPPKTSQVLALLLIARGRTVRAERIIRSIWGEEPPNSARIMVRAHVKKVRDGLGPAGAQAVVAGAGGYAISPETGTLDADLFEASFGAGRRHFLVGQLEEAKRCFLAGLDLWRDVHALNDVREVAELEAEAVRLEEYRFQAEQSLAECLLLTGDAQEAIPYLRMLTVRHPLRERFWGLLMVAQASLGRRAEALSTFRALRRAFVAESGMDVSSEIEDLHRCLLRGDEPAAMMRRLFHAPSSGGRLWSSSSPGWRPLKSVADAG